MPRTGNRDEKHHRLIIIEGEGLLRESLRAALATFEDVSVVGTFASIQAAAGSIGRLQASVAVVGFPKAASPTEVEGFVRFLADFPALPILLLIQGRANLPATLYAALHNNPQAGRCCIVKEHITQLSVLHRAIHACADGFVILDPGVLAPSPRSLGLPGPRGDLPQRFSRRQWEVLELMALGFTNEFIAEKLFISVRTVENHVSFIYQLLPELIPLPTMDFSIYHPRVTMTLLYLHHLASTGTLDDRGFVGIPQPATASQVVASFSYD